MTHNDTQIPGQNTTQLPSQNTTQLPSQNTELPTPDTQLPNPIVLCKGVKKSFFMKEREVVAIKSVDLTVYPGELMMLVGPSGCGKTTLISIIAGILKPTAGHCLLNGVDIGTLSENDLLDFRAKNIGFIFQSFNLIPTITLLENISIPLMIQGLIQEEALERAATVLGRVGLSHLVDRKLTQLSGGEQQRIAIARALVHQPALVVCDEPTSALDHKTGAKVMDLMREINEERHTTFLVVSHDPRIYHYADRIAHMDDGIIVKIEGKKPQ